MKMYALDTNVVIDIIRGKPPYKARFDEMLISQSKGDCGYLIPSVVFYEVMSGFYHTPSKSKQNLFENMCARQSAPYVFSFSKNAVWDKAAQIYATLKQNGKMIGTGDILIAAYCLVNRLTLVTSNTKDFEVVEGLLFEDWTG